jgi:carbamoyltransferase
MYVASDEGKIEYVEHYYGHIASSYFFSGYKNSALVSIDGLGEIESTVIGKFENGKISILQKIDFPNSLGIFYSAITRYLGFKSGSEGTTMALASFGDETDMIPNSDKRYIDIFDEMLILESYGYRLNLDYFNFPYTKIDWVSNKFTNIFGPHREPNEPITKHYKNIAAALQKVFEKGYLHIMKVCKEITGMEYLSLAGGCALNCVANGKIKEYTGFKDIYIQPATHDGGTAIGSAIYYAYKNGEIKESIYSDTTYFGPEFTNDEIEKVLIANHLSYTKLENPEKEAAKLLTDGKVIGWFQGKMEFGPRSLGNRSILANPKSNETKEYINKNVKHRESFRPFAPSALKETAKEYFKLDQDSPFMLIACDINEEKSNDIEAITHIDRTARVQLVTKERNRKYYELINEFYKLSGIPLVLNTSFNDKGEPIVCSPEDALKSFKSTNLDTLIMGDFIIHAQ